jgi:hypothetical protein
MAVGPSALAARRVGRLHIRARSEQDARQAAVLFADALNTASLPGVERERLIVIRRLALGRIAVRGSATSVALQLEQAARDAATEAVSIESTAADAANAVVFEDRAHALAALSRALGGGGRSDQWFWPLVVPGWSPTEARSASWVRLMDAAHGRPDAPVLAATVLEGALRYGDGDELLGAVAPGAGVRWLRLEGWSDIAPAKGARPWRPTSRRSARMVGQWSAAWGGSDDRTIWLATLLTCMERPASIADPDLPARVAFAMTRVDIATLATSIPENAKPSAAGRPASSDRRHADNSHGSHHPGTPDRRSPEPPLARSAHAEARGEIVETWDRDRNEPATELAERHPSPDIQSYHERAIHGGEGFFTYFAGIYFVLPVLERLHFPSFLAAYPELVDDDFARRLLWFIAQRAGLPPTDPLAHVFEGQCGTQLDVDAYISDEWVVPAPVQEMLAAPRPRTSLSSPALVWLTAVRRWCRRRARIGVSTLIRRPGRINLSRTYIETSFALSNLDLSVRRAALDVDPGWVPWMGRVVQFRYGGHDDR